MRDGGSRDPFSPQVLGCGHRADAVPLASIPTRQGTRGGGGGSATGTSAQEDGLGPPRLRLGAAAAHQQELHPAVGTGEGERALGGESPQLGFGASGLTCRVPGRAGAHCRGPVCPGPCTPCHSRLAGRAGSAPSRNRRPLPSPESCRRGQWAAACTGARQPGTRGF